ncbi:galectin-9-like [Drosophila innubila]|uniref:galectin-9-like n=1 Tax=Drosophila innubila TaxID=198719 RepID=UPI00148DA13C|nr:galectin-9-like [Drosophila innubila]
MGLVWTLIIHYSISMPKWDGEDDQVQSGATPKQRLLNWIQSKLPDMPIKNFTHDWTTGKPVGALVDACAPGLCPDWELWDPNDAVANATEAMTLADDWLDVRQLIKPEELVDPNVDEQSVMTYLSQYPSANLKEGAPLRPKSDQICISSPPSVDGVRAYGPGIEPVGIVIGTTVKFTVETLAVGQGDVDVDIVDPNGYIEHAYVEGNNDMNLTYTISYMPKLEGQHKVIVRYSGIEIPNSPFYVEVVHPVEVVEVAHPVEVVRPAEVYPNLEDCNDKFLDLPIECNSALIDHLCEGMSLTLIGQIDPKCNGFSINFIYPTEAEDIALHINPRLVRKFIVRNTKLNGFWGPEEVDTPTSFTLSRGSRFKIQVLVTSDYYLISINNQAFAQYKHRLPFEAVRILRVDGDVELYRIYRTFVIGYPSGFPHFGPSVGELYELPLVENCVPIGELSEGYSFIFSGRVASNCDQFSINFVYDNKKRDVALHVATRFENKCIVRNTKKNNVWGRQEVSAELPFLLSREGTFTIQVLVTTACYLISINGHHFAQFTHRMSYEAVRFLEVLGEVENAQIYRTMVHGYP